jgi:hypothetical protein
VHEVLARPHPDLCLDRDSQIFQPFRRHEAAIAHAAREARLLRAEQEVAHRGVDAVGAHQHVDLDAGSVLELRLDPVAVAHEARQAMADMHVVRRQGRDERSQYVGAVHLVMGRPERGLHRLRKRSTQQRSAVLPAALVERQRPDAQAGQCICEAEPVQDTRGIGADLDAGANLAPARRHARRCPIA